MDNNEDIFEELDDEIVSSDQMMEEQSNDVPSKSNIGNNFKNLHDFEKNNKSTIERLNNAKNGNRSHIGRDIGNKIAGRSEEEKSEIEKAGDQVAGKVAGAGITAATGGLVGGELANQVGDAAVQVAKKYISNKIKIYVFVGVAIISLIFIIILAMNADDVDDKESKSVNNYVTGSMSDDELYDYLQQNKLPLLIHTGDYRYTYSHPARLKKLLHLFPDLIAVGAHFGGWSVYDLALEYLENEKCYMDTSSSFMMLGLRRARELIRLYGAERMLFGTDFPMWHAGDELSQFLELGLTDEENQLILHKNAEKLLNI